MPSANNASAPPPVVMSNKVRSLIISILNLTRSLFRSSKREGFCPSNLLDEQAKINPENLKN